MRISCLSLFLLIILISCNNKSKYRKAADEIAANAPAPTNMNSGKDQYSLYIPVGWTTEHRLVYGVNYYFLSAPKTPDDPNTNINVASEYMQNLSLEEYRQKTIESIQKAIPSATILAQGDFTSEYLKGVWYSYAMAPQGIKATLVCYIFPKGGVAYIITAGTQTKDAIRYRGLFDSIARSFKFDE